MSRSARNLSDEERILWNQVARTATPLKGKSAVAVEPAMRTPEAGGAAPPRPTMREATPKPKQADRLQLQHLDRETRDKLGKGRLDIGGRIDLHGLRQDEAHSLLHGFLLRASERGLRYVLVITGKGFSSGGDGVLRRSVPGWLATPGFRQIVSGYEQANRAHGGEGALYVRLRRREQAR